MFGRLVISSPSRWAAVIASTSAASRVGRRSDTSGNLARESAERELVAVGAQPDDAAHGRAGEHGAMTLGLARVNVRHVDLDERNRDGRQRIANRQARVRIRAGVDDDAVDAAAQRLNRVDQLSLAVMLSELQLDTDLPCYRPQRTLDVVERLVAVQRRFARPEQIQVRAV